MSKMVVIVDDSENVAAALAIALEAQVGVSTLVARHPLAALSIFQSECRVSALVTDLSLPCFDGFELIGAVRRLPAYQMLPAVMITAEEDAELRAAPAQGRPNVILRKPFSVKEVCNVVKSLLE